MKDARIAAFTTAIRNIAPSKSRREVFADFCELSYCALAKAASPSEEQREKLETQYMSVVKRYRNKDDIRRMPELLAKTINGVCDCGQDFLGSVAGELEVLDAKLGQFFTPYHVSQAMAEITLNDVDQIIAETGFVTVQEPAAGAGGMVLAIADVIAGKGYDPTTHLWVEATELSRATYHMAYVQINARGMAGRVICGNSLTNEVFESALTAGAAVFFAKHGDPFAKQRAAAAEAARESAERQARHQAERESRLRNLGKDNAPLAPTIQLGLFD